MLNLYSSLNIGYFLVYGSCLGLLFPTSTLVVDKMVERSLRDKTQHIVNVLESTSTIEELVETLHRHPPLVHRVTVFKTGGEFVYDSEQARFSAMVSPSVYMAQHPEVPHAFEYGYGYGQFYSQTLQQILVHLALRIDDFHGETMVIRTAFPSSEVESLTSSFRMIFLALGIGLLSMFTLITVLCSDQLETPVNRTLARLFPNLAPQLNPSQIEGIVPPEDYESYRENAAFNELRKDADDHHRTLKQERKERETLLSHLSEGVIVTGEGTRVIYSNPQARKMLGKEVKNASQLPKLDRLQNKLLTLIQKCLSQNRVKRCVLSQNKAGHPSIEVKVVPRDHDQGVFLILQNTLSQNPDPEVPT